jgi:hypothetical protein
MLHSEEGIPAFEELFTYACPKFITANPPPYDDPDALAAHVEDSPQEPAARHLGLFLSDVRARGAVPTMRSFLKLYTSLDAAKLASFLDADEEDMVQQMMAVKAASRCVSRAGVGADADGAAGGLLLGPMIATSDMDFVINEVRAARPPASYLRLRSRAEHGARRRGDRRPPLRGLVHPQHRACAARARRRARRAAASTAEAHRPGAWHRAWRRTRRRRTQAAGAEDRRVGQAGRVRRRTVAVAGEVLRLRAVPADWMYYRVQSQAVVYVRARCLCSPFDSFARSFFCSSHPLRVHARRPRKHLAPPGTRITEL